MPSLDTHSVDYSILHYGDIISFQIDYGWLSSCSFYHDSIPDADVPTSHLRIASIPSTPDVNDAPYGMHLKITDTNVPHGDVNLDGLPEDFSTRCAFQMCPDSGGGVDASAVAAAGTSGPLPLTYGAIVRVIHVATGHHVLATELEVPGSAGICAAQLRRPNGQLALGAASLFYIRPRHAMRSEGEPVRNSDRVILESVQYKERQLCGGDPIRVSDSNLPKVRNFSILDETGPNFNAIEDHVYTGMDAFEKQGWKIVRLAEVTWESRKSSTKLQSLPRAMRGGDFIRLWHRQAAGYLIAREDDAPERLSKVVPFGLVCKKLARCRNHTILPLVRIGSSRMQHSTASIWQVINECSLDGTVVEWLSSIRLRHLLSGQYLCVRVASAKDPPALRIPAIFGDSSETLWGLVVATTRDVCDPRTLFELMPTTTDVEGNTSGRDPVRFGSSLLLRHRKTRVHFFAADAARTAKAHAPTAGNLAFLSPTMKGERRYKSMNGLRRTRGDSGTFSETPIKTRRSWWEYVGDRGLAPSLEDPSSEVYRVSVVPQEELRDVLHVMKHIPALRAAVTEVWQYHGEKADPRFENLTRTMRSLGAWVLGEVPRDGVILWSDMYNTDNTIRTVFEMPEPKRFSLHSQQRKSNSSVPNASTSWVPKDKEKWIAPSSQQAISDRQLIALALRIPEYLMHFTTNWAMLVKGLGEEKSTTQSCSILETRFEIRQAAYEAYKLLRALVHKNAHVATTIRALHGVAHMIMHLPLKWNPPIEEVVLASALGIPAGFNDSNMISQFRLMMRSHVVDSNMEVLNLNRLANPNLEAANRNAPTTPILSKAEVFHLVLLVYTACCNQDHNFWHMLDLLCTIAAPGDVPDPSMQSFLCLMLVGEPPVLDTDRPPCANLNPRPKTSMLMETRKGLSGHWQVNLRHVGIPRPGYVPPEGEVDNYLEDERALLKQLFKRYDADGSGAIDRGELQLLLQDLGMPAPLMEAATARLNREEELTWESFCRWWEENRAVFSVTGAIIMDSGSNPAKGKFFRSARFNKKRHGLPLTVSPHAHRKESSKVLKNFFPVVPDESSREKFLLKGHNESKSEHFPQKCPPNVLEKTSDLNSSLLKIQTGFNSKAAAAFLLEEDDSPMPLNELTDDSFKGLGCASKEFHALNEWTGKDGISEESERDCNEKKKFQWRSSLKNPHEILQCLKWRTNVLHKSEGSVSNDEGEEEAQFRVTDDEKAEQFLDKRKGWEEISDVLNGKGEGGEAGGYWVRATFRLLAAVCQGGHISSQKAVSKLAPPDMLLDMLEDNAICMGDKALVVRLLTALYVEHDLIYSSDPLEPQLVGSVALTTEHYLRSPSSQVFCPFSTGVGLADEEKYAEAKTQRGRLMRIIYLGLADLKLDVFSFKDASQHGYAKYQLELLKVTRSLINKGFFYRGGTEALEGATSEVPQIDSLSIGNTSQIKVVEEFDSWFGAHTEEYRGVDTCYTISKFGEKGRIAMGGKPPPPPLLTDDYVVYHYDIESLLMKKWAESIKEHTRERKKELGGFHEEQQEYTNLFSAGELVDIKEEVLKLLTLLQAIKNLQGFQSVLHAVLGTSALGTLVNVEVNMPERLAHGNDKVDVLLSSDGAAERLASAASKLAVVLQVESAQFCLAADFTLHSRQDLLHLAYRHLLALTFNADAFVAMAENVEVTVDPAVARVGRLAKTYAQLIECYGHKAFALPISSSSEATVTSADSIYYQQIVLHVLSELENLALYFPSVRKRTSHSPHLPQRRLFSSRSVKVGSMAIDQADCFPRDQVSPSRQMPRGSITRNESEDEKDVRGDEGEHSRAIQSFSPRVLTENLAPNNQNDAATTKIETTEESRSAAIANREEDSAWVMRSVGDLAYGEDGDGINKGTGKNMGVLKGRKLGGNWVRHNSLGGVYAAVRKDAQTKRPPYMNMLSHTYEFHESMMTLREGSGTPIARFLDALLIAADAVHESLLIYLTPEEDKILPLFPPARLPVSLRDKTADRCFAFLLLIYCHRPKLAVLRLMPRMGPELRRAAFALPSAALLLALVVREGGIKATGEGFSTDEIQELMRRGLIADTDSVPPIWRHCALTLLYAIVQGDSLNSPPSYPCFSSPQYSPGYNVSSPNSLFDSHYISDSASIMDDTEASAVCREILQFAIKTVFLDARRCEDLVKPGILLSSEAEQERIDILKLAVQLINSRLPKPLLNPVEEAFPLDAIADLYAATSSAPLKLPLLQLLKYRVEILGKSLAVAKARRNGYSLQATANSPDRTRGTAGGLGATLAGAKWLVSRRARKNLDQHQDSYEEPTPKPVDTENGMVTPVLSRRESISRHRSSLSPPSGPELGREESRLQRKSRSCSPEVSGDEKRVSKYHLLSCTRRKPRENMSYEIVSKSKMILERPILKTIAQVTYDLKKIVNMSWLQDNENVNDEKSNTLVDSKRDYIAPKTSVRVDRALFFLQQGVIPFLMSVLLVYCPSCTSDAVSQYLRQFENLRSRGGEVGGAGGNAAGETSAQKLNLGASERGAHVGVSSVISSFNHVKLGRKMGQNSSSEPREQHAQYAAVLELCKATVKCESFRLAILEDSSSILEQILELVTATIMCQGTNMDGSANTNWTPSTKVPILFSEAITALQSLKQGAEACKDSSQRRLARGVRDRVVNRIREEITLRTTAVHLPWPMDTIRIGTLPPRYRKYFNHFFRGEHALHKTFLPHDLLPDFPQAGFEGVDKGSRSLTDEINLGETGMEREKSCILASGIMETLWLIPEEALRKAYFSKYMRQQLQGFLESNSIRTRLMAVVKGGGESLGFEEFRQKGGLYLARAMGAVPSMVDSGDLSTSLFLLETLQTLLEDRVNVRRRDQSLSSKMKLKLVEQEARQLRRIQDGLVSLGAHLLIMRLLGRVPTFLRSNDRALVTRLLPRALCLGTSLLSHGNDFCQNSFIESFYDCIDNPNEIAIQCFPRGLLHVLNHLRLHMEHLGTMSSGGGEGEEQDVIATVQLFPLYKAVVEYTASLCASNNVYAKDFLREQSVGCSGGYQANLVTGVSLLVHATCKVVCTRIKYVRGREWETCVAPQLPGAESRRRFIAWHRSGEADLPLLQNLFLLLKGGFLALTEMVQGPNTENQILCLKSIQYAGAILEYCGALYLNLTSIAPSGVKRTWHGGDPVRFIREYLAEAKVNKEMHGDRGGAEIEEMTRAIARWQSMPNGPSRFIGFFQKTALSKDDNSCIVGVDVMEFKKAAGACEEALLQLLLGLLEGQSARAVAHLECHTDMPVLVQNMECALKLKRKGGGAGSEVSNKVVLYLTLATSLAEGSSDSTYKAHSRRLLNMCSTQTGQGSSSLRGRGRGRKQCEDLIASIEIMGQNKEDDPHQVFFPVPNFVKEYWDYPEVRKTRYHLIYAISRDSPEEKILDFYNKMEQLISTMKRQERLRQIFGPLHGLVGGKSPWFIPYWLPNQRMALLMITILLNIWLVYTTYMDDHPDYEDVFVTLYFYDWSHRDTVITAVKFFHVGMCGSLLFARMINYVPAYSHARRHHARTKKRHDGIDGREADKAALKDNSHANWFGLFVYMSEALWDSLWELIMLGVSIAGGLHSLVWYSIAVLDIIPQSRVMTFVLQAVYRNLGKIFTAIVLLMMALYFYSIISWLSWPSQYEIANHGGCDSILNCWLLHLNYGMLEAPSWSTPGFVNPEMPNIEDASETAIRWYGVGSTVGATAFQLMYYIVVNLVMGAILAGVIIDTFSEMRQESETKEADIRDKCFICSLDRDSFEQVGVIFNTHISEEHNLWKYVWFKLYLEQKDPLSYTGPEHHAARLFKRKNDFVRLIPIKKALAIRRAAGTVRETQDLTTVYSRVKELGEITIKLTEMLSTRFSEQDEDSKRLRILTKQGERMEKSLRRMEKKHEVGRRESMTIAIQGVLSPNDSS